MDWSVLLQKRTLNPAKYFRHYSISSCYVRMDKETKRGYIEEALILKVEGEKRGWVYVTDEETVGRMKKETDLIFSSVTQSSEVLVVPVRLYDTMMLGSA